MKLIDIYNENKKKYEEYVILIKCGFFYETLNDDALVMNKIFNYKIKESASFTKAGFPVAGLGKITNELNKLKVNYIIYEGEVILKKKFNINNYDKYLVKLSNEERIERIYKTLMVYRKNNMDDLLRRIESII